MPPCCTGRRIALSPSRLLIADLMHFSKQVPLVIMERRMSLAGVVAARRAAESRPSWCAIFTKAYARICARTPELRRSYMPFPWASLYENDQTVANIAVERWYGDERAVGFVFVGDAEEWPLTALHDYLMHCKERPPEHDGSRLCAQRFSRLPKPLRRLVWWYALNYSGATRAECFGTFGVTAMASSGSTSHHVLAPITTTLFYGILAADGGVDVRLAFDHRAFDGGVAADALKDLENELCGPITAELCGLHKNAA